MGCWAAGMSGILTGSVVPWMTSSGSQIKPWIRREGKCGSWKDKTRIPLAQFSHWSWFPLKYQEKFLPQRNWNSSPGNGHIPKPPEFGEHSQGCPGWDFRIVLQGRTWINYPCVSFNTQYIPWFQHFCTYSTQKSKFFQQLSQNLQWEALKPPRLCHSKEQFQGGADSAAKLFLNLGERALGLSLTFFPKFSTWRAHLENPNISVFS